jgi:hypothetical protein
MEQQHNKWARQTVGSTNASPKIALNGKLPRSNTDRKGSIKQISGEALDIVSAMTSIKASSSATLDVATRIAKLPWAKKNLMDKVLEQFCKCQKLTPCFIAKIYSKLKVKLASALKMNVILRELNHAEFQRVMRGRKMEIVKKPADYVW